MENSCGIRAGVLVGSRDVSLSAPVEGRRYGYRDHLELIDAAEVERERVEVSLGLLQVGLTGGALILIARDERPDRELRERYRRLTPLRDFPLPRPVHRCGRRLLRSTPSARVHGRLHGDDGEPAAFRRRLCSLAT